MSNSVNVWVPILVAIITGLVTVITVFLTGRANRRLERDKFEANTQLEQQKLKTTSILERRKFESSLILQAISTGKQRTAQKNLEFLVSAGFLPDPEGKIKALATRPADTPVLPARCAQQVKSRPPIFRRDVRTGSDPDAPLVEEAPVPTTVEEFVKEPRPAEIKNPTERHPAFQDRRTEGAERTIYEVEAEIVAYKEMLSGSYRLSLKGETGRTMVANCVDPKLVDPGSRWAKQIAEVRREIKEKLKPRRAYTHGSRRVRITGIGFFNHVHGQSGVTPNGIELTPVLGVKWL